MPAVEIKAVINGVDHRDDEYKGSRYEIKVDSLGDAYLFRPLLVRALFALCLALFELTKCFKSF